MATISSSLTQEGVPNRRKSGRSIRRPDLFAEEMHEKSLLSNSSAKRKRVSKGKINENAENEEEEEEHSDLDEDESESEGEADEEELVEKRRAARSRKPATKKQKVQGNGTTLAIRSANIPGKPASKTAKVQKARARQSQANQDGLYAEVFGRGQSGEEAAAEWLQSLEKDSVAGVRDFINLILKCTGCELKVEEHDIEDIDNVPSKLADLQEEYQQAKPTDYPLISKLKQHVGFRDVLTDFVNAVIKVLHNSSTLYEDEGVFWNIHTWLATMSSAGIRPFRHTATVVSLSMSTALCEIAKDLQSSLSTTRSQIEAEKKKKKVNEGRVRSMKQTIGADEKRLAAIDALLKDEFDTVFVHRYRDVDAKIRVECMAALGTWISTYRKMFLDGEHLRYLGWILSDTTAQTRSEVVKQLKMLFKNPRNIAALRAFTDRFRPRMVEMASRDAEPGIRADAIDLLDRLRDAELLEPDDIDTVGRLIFDTEPRVRKAVAKFFVSNIEDLYKAQIEDMDQEQYEAALPKDRDSDNYSLPTQTWIKFKCLAQTLSGYDTDGSDDGRGGHTKDTLAAGVVESRYMLATEAIFPHMPELQEWESLAGYLLYDHSQITSESDDPDVAQAVQGVYKLNPGEETILLEVLDYAVKLSLLQIIDSQTDKKGRKTKASRDDAHEQQEHAAHSLTILIPQLLNKFGSTPQAAAAILRLEHLVNADVISDLQNSEITFSALLDDIDKQFSSHSDRNVLAEASLALVKARSHEQSKEATEAKLAELWDETLSSLQSLLKGQNVDSRGTLSSTVLTEVSNTVARLSNLASIADCTEVLDNKLPTPGGKKQRSKASTERALDLLLQLAKRGVADQESTTQFAELEDDLCSGVIKTMLFYFMWKALNLRTSFTNNAIKRSLESDVISINTRRERFVEVLTEIITSRSPLDPVRLLTISSLLDLMTVFSTLRHAKPATGPALPDEIIAHVKSLLTEVPADLHAAIMLTHDRLEKSLANKLRRKLEPPASSEPGENDAPMDSDDENLDDEELDVVPEAGSSKDAKKQAALMAEKRLCELTSKMVLAVVGRAMNADVKERLMRNKSRLGQNYSHVLAYLEDKKERPKKAAKGLKGKGRDEIASGGVKARGEKGMELKSAAMVLEEDDIEDDEMEKGDDDHNEDADMDMDREADEGADHERGDSDAEEVLGD